MCVYIYLHTHFLLTLSNTFKFFHYVLFLKSQNNKSYDSLLKDIAKGPEIKFLYKQNIVFSEIYPVFYKQYSWFLALGSNNSFIHYLYYMLLFSIVLFSFVLQGIFWIPYLNILFTSSIYCDISILFNQFTCTLPFWV